MYWDFKRDNLGIICADAAFCCTESNRLRRGPWSSSVLGRKGSREFNEFVVEQVIGPSGKLLDKVFVVGEGRSDIRLYEALESAAPAARSDYSVSGFFFHNSDLGQGCSISDRCHHFATWDSLAVELGAELSNAARDGAHSLVLVDVDRTIIYPKGEADGSYAEMRIEALWDYISGFRTAPLPTGKSYLKPSMKVISIHSRDFKNELDEITFRNFELIAVTLLLVCVGLVRDADLPKVGQKNLLDTVETASYKLEEGREVSWIDWAGPGDESNIFAIRDVWNLPSLEAHLRDIRNRLVTRDAVICPRYRESECRVIDAVLDGDASLVLNRNLMTALRAATGRHILQVTDRPAASLGIDGGGDGRGCSSRYWECVR